MNPDDSWLLDMMVHARRPQRVDGVTLDQFLADRDKRLAVTHIIMIVGEE